MEETRENKPVEIRQGRKRRRGKTENETQHTKGEHKSNKDGLEKQHNSSSNNSQSGNNACTSSNNNSKQKNEKRCASVASGSSGNKFNFRAPQQFQLFKKKNWNKKHLKGLHCSASIGHISTGGGGNGHGHGHIQGGLGGSHHHIPQNIKADVENLPNIKNQLSHHRQTGCNNSGQKNSKQQQQHSKKKILGGGIISARSKFFLADKRPRKEIIIPPTKFLLGGNISDPLNLNSLQEEAQSGNATPSTTPRQSPVTTPPKIEVIIPPNIHDPLHLLDPVDSIEYEKQLVSPMKRKHRHRKKKPKRKRLISQGSSLSIASTPAELNFTKALSNLLKSENDEENVSGEGTSFNDSFAAPSEEKLSVCNVTEACGAEEIKQSNLSTTIRKISSVAESEVDLNKDTVKEITCSTEKRRSELIERISKELKLDLDITAEQHKQNMMNSGRKRKISEAGSCKNKFRRLDSMDKIVSPVVPQPGAWKRPPRNTPTGARKGNRIRSISNSEADVSSPLEESKPLFGHLEAKSSIQNLNNENKTEEQSENTLTTIVSEQVDNEIKIEIKTSAQEQKQQSMPKFRVDGARYQYGNYDRYSGYNTVNEFIDIRLQVLQRNPELFFNKDVLDIGCNVGHMAIAVAKKLSPKSILGIDIDSKMISKARRNISLYVRIPKETEDTDVTVITCSKNSSSSIVNKSIDIEDPKYNSAANVVEEVQKPLTFKDLVNKRFEELQTDSTENPKTKKISKTKLKRKIYFEIKRKNKAFQKQFLAEQRRLQENTIETFPISFPICYGPIPSLGVINQYTSNCSPSNLIINTDTDRTTCGIGAGTANINPGSACNSANATPARSTGGISVGGATTTSGSNMTELKRNKFPLNVFFRQANYVLKDENAVNNEQQQYDLILCLSVTKWIHLNFGDNGLKLAFKRMFNQLRPGGKLILEAQNWASYKKKKNLTETIYRNYNSIEFFPNKFHEYLLSNEVGFSHSYTLGVPKHLKKGFCRPIQLYAKGDFTPNHVRWSDAYCPQTPYEAYRGIYASIPRPPYPLWGSWDSIRTPRGNSSSCRQTPYYNPLESDSYLPSYDTEVLNRHYVFASPLYQTVWSPPASLRNSSSHTPVFGSVREVDNDSTSGGSRPRHVYLPNDESNSPKIVNGAFNSIREEAEQDSNSPGRHHVYANCDSSLSPHGGDASVSDNEQNLPQNLSSSNMTNNTGSGHTPMVNGFASGHVSGTSQLSNERSQDIHVSDSNDSSEPPT